jgi:hypothetical protein
MSQYLLDIDDLYILQDSLDYYTKEGVVNVDCAYELLGKINTFINEYEKQEPRYECRTLSDVIRRESK